MLSIDAGRAPQFGNCKFLDAQPERHQPVAELSLQLANVEEIRHGEFERQKEHLIEKVRPFEVYDDRSVRD